VHEWGRADADPVVLLHGFSDDGACWEPFVRRAGWVDRFRLLAPDAPGHGGSALVGAGSDVALDVERLAATLDACAPAGEVVLIGHSMGALGAAAFALAHPARVRGLVLEDPVWRVGHPLTADRRPSDGSEHPLATHVRRLRRLSTRHRILAGRLENPTWSADELSAWAAAKERVDLSLFDSPVRWSPLPWWELAARLEVPTLLVTGSPARGAIVTDEAAELALSALAQGTRAHRPDAGHCIRRDDPDGFAEAVEGFVRTLPS
jgi:N-formylmaleamate deformylase